MVSPKVTGSCFGRLYDETTCFRTNPATLLWKRPTRKRSTSARFSFVGFNLTVSPQLLLGARGMPRRYYDCPQRFESLNALSTYGSWVLAAGLILILGYFVHSLLRGERADVNPWGAATLEWRAVPTLPLEHNYRRTPVVPRGPYAYHQIDDLLGHDLAAGLSGDGEGGSVPTLTTPQESPVQEEPSPEESQAH